ncbi:hypothetical protein PHISCL_00442 [Aspergillus sclerotialis]|uniref:DUF7726 domain-containing protein n=1 Tax=Aspergillus sclerotialis TaxID=2070753 RepID=A0A3A3AD21_9EURO|nr:hypothetical protein PHISCL_00442 [Aspergillus sclerotialis]
MPPKRTASTANIASEPIPEISSDDERLNYITADCNKIRRQIRSFIESGEMKVGEFQNAIGMSSKSYGAFMKQRGADAGFCSDTYYGAARFFKKRELQGIKMPKRAKTSKEDKEAILKKYDVFHIQLEGESEMKVLVFDTCDVIRKKIHAHLRRPGMTQTMFLGQLEQISPVGINTRALHLFLSKSGPSAGNTSGIFYSSYVFFEKLRIKEGKPKTQFREQMERIWENRGMDRERCSANGVWCVGDERPYEDDYGRIKIM